MITSLQGMSWINDIHFYLQTFISWTAYQIRLGFWRSNSIKMLNESCVNFNFFSQPRALKSVAMLIYWTKLWFKYSYFRILLQYTTHILLYSDSPFKTKLTNPKNWWNSNLSYVWYKVSFSTKFKVVHLLWWTTYKL